MVDKFNRDISLENIPNILLCETSFTSFTSSGMPDMDKAPFSKSIVLIDREEGVYSLSFRGQISFNTVYEFFNWYSAMEVSLSSEGVISVAGKQFNYYGGSLVAAPNILANIYNVSITLQVLERP